MNHKKVYEFVVHHIDDLRTGGILIFLRKLKWTLDRLLSGATWIICGALIFIGIFFIRALRPFVVIRFGALFGSRIGHFAANTELYLCERDIQIDSQNLKYIDIFYIRGPISNYQLGLMWGRVLNIWPRWVVEAIMIANKKFPGWEVHEVNDLETGGRDVYDLLHYSSAHLAFTDHEEQKGRLGLRAIGIPEGAEFICLNVRDSAYLDHHLPGDWSYHDYRDSTIGNYVLAAEALAERGYYVIRMGAKVREPFVTKNSRVIDYATNGMRSDFMDIYLGAKCLFAISTGSGWEAIPGWIFRRPVCFVNYSPVGWFCTWFKDSVLLSKHYFDIKLKRNLTLKEIILRGLAYSSDANEYKSAGVRLVENSPREIRDAAIEMLDRLTLRWVSLPSDDSLIESYKNIFKSMGHYQNIPNQGCFRAHPSIFYLRENLDYLR